MTTSSALVDDLAALVGGQARAADSTDRIGGVPAQLVASPGSTDEAAALLHACAANDLAVGIRGQGTALDWGAPPRRLDVIVDTGRLDQVIEHVAGDLVAVVQAGLTLDALNERVGRHGQQLALDQPLPGASIGGTLSTARCGARRVHYGSPRDLVLGVTLVRADGVLAHAGGKVVKNVAGYDLAKLVTGAYGTLGLITEAVFRLHPLAPKSRWLQVMCTNAPEAVRRALTVNGSQLAPSAVEVRRAPGAERVALLVLLEGTEHGVDERTPDLLRLLGDDAHEVSHNAAMAHALPGAASDVLIKTAVPLTGVGTLLAAVAAAEVATDVPLQLSGSAGVGVLYVSAPGDAAVDAVAAVITRLRAACVGGSAVLVHAPAALRESLSVKGIDAWGPVPGLELMRRVKGQFDPQGAMAPGRFVGGI